MAFRSNGPISLALPAFRGVTRRLILISLGIFFGALVLDLVSHDTEALLLNAFILHPAQALHRMPFQLLTYPFISLGLFSVAFSLLSLWFFGSALEDERGGRWLTEYFLTTTIVGGLLASLLAKASANRIPGLEVADPGLRVNGMWPFVLALVLAYASFHPTQELRFNFILTLKAKYLAAIYLLFYLAVALIGGDRFGALTALCNALAGYAYLRLAPRKGLRVGLSERWFSLRNTYYRNKRRRAAKKFAVYMRKQGKDVSLDDEGRYIDPNGKPRDLNDRNWMN